MVTNGIPHLRSRRSGVLLHLTSLPGPHGSGDLGDGARWFVDFLAEAGQSWWQMLPIGPPGYGESPYMASSAFAGARLALSLDLLVSEGLLAPKDLAGRPVLPAGGVRFDEVARWRDPLLRLASSEFFRRGSPADLARFDAFSADHAHWLDDFALYRALQLEFGSRPWTEWPTGLVRREPAALEEGRARHAGEILHQKFLQYEFARQWSCLRDHCRVRGIGLLGDMPIYVAHESADVWAHQEIFQLDERGRPAFVAGVPPDYFSATGQRWGHPLFHWDRQRERGYDWWIARLGRSLGMFDAVRLDHFIGFHRYWEIPARCETAVEGQWRSGPADDFFAAVQRELGPVPILAEDLGAVTPEVTALRDRWGFPGMRVLQFAFGGDPAVNDHLPHRYPFSCAVYTGTHDNDTSVGWYRELSARAERDEPGARREKAFFQRYTGSDGRAVHWDLIRLAQASVSDLAIAPMQDILGLDSTARMNRPSTATGNWRWRLEPSLLDPGIAQRLRTLSETYGRVPAPAGGGAGG